MVLLAALILSGLLTWLPYPASLHRISFHTPRSEFYYLRDDVMPEDQHGFVEIVAVGDVMLGRNVLNRHHPFEDVARELTSADLAIGNLESLIGDPDSSPGDIYLNTNRLPILLGAPPAAISELQMSGFDLLSIANNHSYDNGTTMLKRTAEMMARACLAFIGAGPTQVEAYQPVYYEIKGLKIAILGVNAVGVVTGNRTIKPFEWQIANWDIAQVVEEIQSARSKADVVIILVHWGDEFEQQESPAQRDAAINLIRAGADVVLGSHPHVIQGTEVILGVGEGGRAGFSAYSLGNFVFDQFDEPARLGLVLRMFFDRRGLEAVEPLFVDTYPKPNWVNGPQLATMIERYRPDPEWDAFKCSHLNCDPINVMKPRYAGRFYAGEIDLTGDGEPEVVRLEGERARIFQGNKLVWESPREWRIFDLALGDPNSDGRQEIALALEKTASDGKVYSHPFLIGFRSGIYRQVWGGSAVRYPIKRIEIADLDQDLDQELIILEQREDNLSAVTVWRWNSWVFSQVWNSPEDRFTELELGADLLGLPIILVGRRW